MAQGNVFERRRDLLAQKITQRITATEEAFGVGQRPYGTKKLSGQEKQDYWASLGPQKQQELWGQMDESERAEVQGG
jgi:hypothetical protein